MANPDLHQGILPEKVSSRKSLFFLLWGLCILGSWSVLPYAQHLSPFLLPISFAKIFLLTTIQSTIAFGIVCFLSYLIVPKTDLLPFVVDKPLRRIVYPGVFVGVGVGTILQVLDMTVLKASLLSKVHPPAWTGLLASFYGAINEEVLLRLFLFTLIYFLFRKMIQLTEKRRVIFLWVTNVIVAIIFGLGHLPAAFKLVEPSSFEVIRVLLLNGIPGIVFGWLYWSRGLWAAMTAHFVTDLVVHVFVV